MTTYHQLMSRWNNSWKEGWETLIDHECSVLKNLWLKYTSDPVKNEYPPKIRNNTLFNFTNYIIQDMPTFLAGYSEASKTIRSQSTNATRWGSVAKVVVGQG